MPTSPSPRLRRIAVASATAGLLFLAPPAPAQAPARAAVPTQAEVTRLVEREPMTLENWPVWRRRLLDWIGDRSEATTPAYVAVWQFLKAQATPAGEPPPELAKDSLAWYFLGSAYLDDAGRAEGVAGAAALDRAEKAVRRSIQLDPNLANAHARLATVLFRRGAAGGGKQAKPPTAEARNELREARRLNPNLPYLAAREGELEMADSHFGDAERLFEQAVREHPEQVAVAQGLGMAVVMNVSHLGPRSKRLQELVDRFPDDGPLACLHAVTMAQEDHMLAAARELRRARGLGTDPSHFLPPEVVHRIEKDAAPWQVLATFGWVMLGFAVSYAVLMALMAGFGLLLARRTRGSRALRLLGAEPEELITEGQIARTAQESSLAKLYAAALVLGLVLFYVSIPFIMVGLLAGTALLLYGIFLLPRIPVKLIVIVVVVGLGGVWAVFKSLFSRPARGAFGLAKTAADCPRLYQALGEVAKRVDTDAVDEVYLAPGSEIGVHQEGRGMFGVLGVQRRVLTLGLSTMTYLTVSELQAILAHEYAHFSHRDTHYNRFIYQVSLSISQALQGMGQSGGSFNYVNPFFWFLYLYHRAYHLLSAGFSRSREFLADRMASALYGADVFASALTKVCTDGRLFEMTMYGNVNQLLEQDKSFVNMYAAFRSFRDEQMSAADRDKLYQDLLEERESVFASHPTFRERIDAVADLPPARNSDARPALELFENPEEVEKELTEFLTAYIYHVRQLQSQASAAAS